jgi:hypothetical protein
VVLIRLSLDVGSLKAESSFRNDSTINLQGMSAKKGLYANINAKRKRIAKGSSEKMRKPGAKGAPSKKDFKASAKAAKKRSRKGTTGRSRSGQSKKATSRA